MNVNQALSFICTTHEKSFFPEKFRRYLNFRLMTAVVVVFMSINFALNILSEPEPSSEIYRRVDRIRSVAHSPTLLILENVGLGLGFWLVFCDQEKETVLLAESNFLRDAASRCAGRNHQLSGAYPPTLAELPISRSVNQGAPG
jgi:hypothetical protein